MNSYPAGTRPRRRTRRVKRVALNRWPEDYGDSILGQSPGEGFYGRATRRRAGARRSIPRSLTEWRTPGAAPVQSAGPKIPGEERDRRFRTKSGRRRRVVGVVWRGGAYPRDRPDAPSPFRREEESTLTGKKRRGPPLLDDEKTALSPMTREIHGNVITRQARSTRASSSH